MEKRKVRKINFYNPKAILLLILLLSFIFRFYNQSKWVSFDMDQEYEAFLVKNIVTFKHFPLIGVNASDTGLYLGPAFLYLASIPFAIFSGNPLGWAITSSILGIFVSFLIYKIGKEMFSEKVGLFASFIYSVSFLTSFYDRQFWNPTLVPLLSLLIGYFLYRLINKDSKKLIWLAVVFGLALHSHLSLIIFVPLILYVILRMKKYFSKKTLYLSLFIFLLIQSPLILFDLRHNFANTRAAFNLVLGNKKQQVTTSSLKERNFLFISSLGRFFWLPSFPDLFLESGQCRELAYLSKKAYPEGILMVMAGMTAFIYWCYKKKYKRKERITLGLKADSSKRIILSIFSITFLFIVFYRLHIFEYYLLYLFPWLAIALGLTLDRIWQTHHGEIIVIPVIVLFALLNFITLISSSFSYSYQNKIKAISFAKPYLQNQSYTLEALGECTRFGGYRYLFEYLIGPPIRSYMDSYFAWLYPDQIKETKPNKLVLLSLIDPRDKMENISKWEEIKLRYLAEYNLIAEKRFEQIHLFIFSPKAKNAAT